MNAHDPGESPTEHPSTDRLADFAADILPTGQATEVDQHLADCAVCRSTIDGLADVADLLQSAPAEVAIPGDVAARVNAAIENAADEWAAAADRAHQSATGAPVAWFRRRLPRAMAAAASVAVLALAGYVALSDSLFGDGADDATVADAPAPADEANQLDADVESRPGNEEAEEGSADDAGEDVLSEAEAELAAGLSPAQIRSLMREIYNEELAYRDECGRPIAREQGQQLVGSVETESDVLVVLEDTDAEQLNGWLLPACESPSRQATMDVVTIPIPAE